MKVLVTGGAGFIASNIVDALLDAEHEVAVIDNLSTGSLENVNPAVLFFEGDICDESKVDKWFKEFSPDIVIHHAAQVSVQHSLVDPVKDASTNVQGTIVILKYCTLYKVKKIIYASSAAIYGKPQYLAIDEEHPIAPISFYGLSKYVPEQYIHLYSSLHNLDFTILRYANAYGERQDPLGEGGVVSIFMDKMLERKAPIIYGKGEQTRDFIYVKDIVQANLLALTKGKNEVLNISTAHKVSVNELFETISQISGFSEKAIQKEARTGDIEHSFLSNSKAAKVLGWEPAFSLRMGLESTFESYKKEKRNAIER